MTGYVMDFKERGQFDPDGKVVVSDVDAHNAELEAQELEAWALKPDRWHCYVTDKSDVTTWLGTKLGTILRRNTWRNNFGAKITHLTIRGTNGATYHGSFGSDWSQLCRIRKHKGKANA